MGSTAAGLHPLVVANKQHLVLTGSAIHLSFLTHIEHFHPTTVCHLPFSSRRYR